MNNTKGSSSILFKSSSKNSLSVKNFGSKVFNELLISSWMQTKKIESVSQAWAFVKLCEMIAGRLLQGQSWQTGFFESVKSRNFNFLAYI